MFHGSSKACRSVAVWGGVVGLLIISAAPGQAVMRSNYWRDVDGIFAEASNWTDDTFYPSTTNDWAYFSMGTVRKVTFNADALGYSTQIHGGDTAVHWDLGTHTYTLTSDNASTASATDGTALVVGAGSDGASLTVSNGTLVTAGFAIGRTFTASMTVTGENTVWNNFESGEWATVVGFTGTTAAESVLRIEDGAQVNLHRLRVGHSGGSRGALIVTGASTRLTNSNNVTIGNFGHGRAVISDGARWDLPSHTINLGFGTLGTSDGSGTLEIDGGRVAALNVRFDRGTVISTFKVTLYSGETNALVTVTRDFLLGEANTVFDLNLTDDFDADLDEIFTIVQARAGGGSYAFSGKFIDGEGGTIEDGDILTASTSYETYEFRANYTVDDRFTLTVIPEPGIFGLLGMTGLAWFVLRRRTQS